MKWTMLPLVVLLGACTAGNPLPVAAPDEPRPASAEAIKNEPDRGERALVGAFMAREDAARVCSAFLLQEAAAVHGGLDAWQAGFGELAEFGVLYSRNGAPGRFQTAKVKTAGGVVDVGFYLIDDSGALRVDNVLSVQPVVPGATPAVFSSRANVLRAFWGYYGALVGVAPEFLPDRAALAPAVSARLRLAHWRSSVSPDLRARMLRSGPERCRDHVPNYLDSMGALLASYHTPQVREANLAEGRLIAMFTPTDAAAEQGRRPFSLSYRSGWWHGMQVLTAEEAAGG